MQELDAVRTRPTCSLLDPPSHTPLLRRRPRSWPWPSSSLLLALFLSLLCTHLVFPVPGSPGPGLNGRSLCERGELIRAEECKVVLVVLWENGVPDMRDRAGRRLARSGLGRRCKWLEMRRRGLGMGRHGLCLAEEGRERRRARKGRESANKDGRESEARLERVGFGRSRWASETKVEGRTLSSRPRRVSRCVESLLVNARWLRLVKEGRARVLLLVSRLLPNAPVAGGFSARRLHMVGWSSRPWLRKHRRSPSLIHTLTFL